MSTETASNPNHKWYIVHAYSNFEKKVAESIREQARSQGLEDSFSEILVPTENVVEIRRGRKVDAERKFFPGYVLVKMNLSDEAYHLIKNTPKVTGFLGSGSKPQRETGVLVALDAHGLTDGRPRTLDLAPLYTPLRTHFTDLNIEGAFVCGAELLLLQRGNKGDALSASIHFDWHPTAAWLAGQQTPVPRPRRVQPLALGDAEGAAHLVATLRYLFPNLRILARARTEAQGRQLSRAGADEVVVERQDAGDRLASSVAVSIDA